MNVTDVNEPPGTPSVPTFGTKTHYSVVVNWATPSNTGPAIDDYDVQYRVGTGSFIDAGYDGTTTSTTLTGLTPSTTYDVQVRASNAEGDSAWSSSGSVTTEANTDPEFSPATATRSVAENTASSTDIGDAFDAATDAEGDSLTYTLGGTDASSFDFDASTRQLSTSASLDYETKTSYSVTVTASDGHGGTADLAVTVNVTDVDEAPDTPTAPTFGTKTHVSVVVNWAVPANTGPAIDDYDVQYRVGSTGNFTDASYDGTTTSTTLTDLTPSTTYEVQVRASNDEGTGAWSLSGSVTTEANTDPEFSPDTATRDVAENTASGTVIGTALPAATDADGDSLTYSLGGTDSSSFTFDASTRQLSTSASLDYETKDSYTVTVTAADGLGGTDELTVTVNVTDDNTEAPDAPDAPTFGTKTRYTVVVNWMAPTNAGPDIDDYDVQYRAGTTGSFTDWSHTGTTLTTTLEGLDSATTYEVQVRASNDEGTGDWSSSGSVTTNANQAPAFSPATASRSVDENTASGTGIGAALPAATDGDNDTLTYSLGGTDAASFDFDETTRQLSTSASLDYETKDSFSLTVTADDGHGDTAELTVTVTVTDVNEPPDAPDAPTFGTPERYQVAVNWTAPTNTGPPITDYDVQYREGTTGAFTDASFTGTTLTTTLMDLESATAYQVQVRATNAEGTGAWSSSGSVTTAANKVPEFDPATASRSLDENTPGGTNIGAALPEATDGDDDTLTYSLGGTDASSFDFDASTRQLSTAAGASFDHETKDTYSVTVTADDGHGDSADLAVTVSVNDVDEPPDAPAAPTFGTPERYQVAVNWTAPTNMGPPITDYDLQYREVGSSSFDTWPFTGTTTTVTLTGLESATAYEVQVRAANDEGMGDWSSSGSVTTAANKVPEFDPATTSRSVSENAAAGTAVGAALPAATDGDDDPLTYSLGGTDAASFVFNASTRQLSTAAGASFDYETKDTYAVTVSADDGHGGTGTLAITVPVIDVDEPPDAPAAPMFGTATRTSLAVYWLAPSTTGPPITDYDVRYRAAPGDQPFADAGHDGPDTGRTITGLEPGVAYEVQVRARNDEGAGGWSPSGQGRTVTENAPPIFESANTRFDVAENTLVAGSVTATDPDPEDEVSYSVSGTDASLFQVRPDATLEFLSPPSYEAPLGGALDSLNTYSVTVIATGGAGVRAMDTSMDYQVRVTDVIEPPTAPAGPTFGPALPNSLVVRWDAPANTGPPIRDYDVRYRAAEPGDEPFIDAGHDGTETEHTIARLEVDTAYEVQVRATNVEGTGPWSNIVARTTAPDRARHVPLFESTGDARREGFARIINNSPPGAVEVVAIDESGMHTDAVSLALGVGRAVHFNSSDLEYGNPAKGIPEGGVGASGLGDWRLQLESALDVETLAYSRTTDGFVTSLHNAAPSADGVHWIAFFNPATNVRQVSRLRLVNSTDQVAEVSITGVDDTGADAGPVMFEIPADATVELTAFDLESGVGMTGALGDGVGKWRLQVRSETPLVAQSLLESPSGHVANLSTVPMGAGMTRGDRVVVAFPPAGGNRQGFVRVINRSEEAGSVTILPRDDSDWEYEPLRLTLGPRAAAHFNSDDLEVGARDKGLTGSTGPGKPPWRLYFSSDLDIDVLAYLRLRQDGFLTSVHDLVPMVDGEHRVVFFNPGSNYRQVSRLALINQGPEDATVTVRGTDDLGTSPGSPVVVTVPAGTTLMPTARELETGTGDGIDGGALGDGKGKWRLAVTAPPTVLVMSLLDSPTGHRSNLSTAGDETMRP